MSPSALGLMIAMRRASTRSNDMRNPFPIRCQFRKQKTVNQREPGLRPRGVP